MWEGLFVCVFVYAVSVFRDDKGGILVMVIFGLVSLAVVSAKKCFWFLFAGV